MKLKPRRRRRYRRSKRRIGPKLAVPVSKYHVRGSVVTNGPPIAVPRPCSIPIDEYRGEIRRERRTGHLSSSSTPRASAVDRANYG